MNEVLLLVEILICFGGLLFVKKFLGVSGIYAWITLATCLAEIQVLKSVNVLGISATLGNVLFASTFLATDILSENYGTEYAKKGPFFSLLGALFYILFCIITPLYVPNEFDLVQNSMKQIFSLSIRITVSSVIMLFIANLVDVFLYDVLMRRFKGKRMWIRNNVCTIISNCTENYFFTFLAFYGNFDVKTCLVVATSTSCIEIFTALLDTPFLYLSKKIK